MFFCDVTDDLRHVTSGQLESEDKDKFRSGH